MVMLDPYYLLDVPYQATPDEIRAAYRRRAAELHPDIHPPEKREWASEQMKQLNAARDLLLDPAQRIAYNEHSRLEMKKAMWRARRDAPQPPEGTHPRRRMVPGYWLVLFFAALPWVCLALVSLFPSETRPPLMMAFTFGRFVLSAAFAILFTLFLAAVLTYAHIFSKR